MTTSPSVPTMVLLSGVQYACENPENCNQCGNRAKCAKPEVLSFDGLSKNEIFTRLLKKFDYLVSYAAERMSIPGKLDADDQYQNGSLVLYEILGTTLNGGIYAFRDPFCTDFERVFKTNLWQRLTQTLNARKAGCRDFRKEVAATIETEDGDEVFLWDMNPNSVLRPSQDGPDQSLLSEELLGEIRGYLSENGVRLLNLLADPTPMFHLIETYRRTCKAPRLGKSIPLHIYREFLGMNRFPFEDLWGQVKKVIVQVVGQYRDLSKMVSEDQEKIRNRARKPVVVPVTVPVTVPQNQEFASVGC